MLLLLGHWRRLKSLGAAPIVEHSDLLRAGDCAERSAGLLGVVLAAQVLHRVLGEGNAGIAALLRAPVDQAILADIEIARTGAATPFVRLALGDVVLEL